MAAQGGGKGARAVVPHNAAPPTPLPHTSRNGVILWHVPARQLEQSGPISVRHAAAAHACAVPGSQRVLCTPQCAGCARIIAEGERNQGPPRPREDHPLCQDRPGRTRAFRSCGCNQMS